MKKGDIVKFKTVVEPGDENVLMVVNWVDGGRVQVTALVGMNINPTYIYPESDLVATALGTSLDRGSKRVILQ